MALKNVEIGTSNTNVFDGTQGTQYAFTVLLVTNTSGTNATFTLYAIDGTDPVQTPANKNTILKDIIVTAGDTFTLDTEKMVLGETDKIIAVSDTLNALNLTVSYVEL